jgi:hypothetical protein
MMEEMEVGKERTWILFLNFRGGGDGGGGWPLLWLIA